MALLALAACGRQQADMGSDADAGTRNTTAAQTAADISAAEAAAAAPPRAAPAVPSER